jgi:hypothetical protein
MPLIVSTPFTEKEKVGMDPILWMQAECEDLIVNPDIDTAKLFYDCIVLLCQKKQIRQELRDRKVYPICRNFYYKYDDERLIDIVHDVVNFLEREDDPNDVDEEKQINPL